MRKLKYVELENDESMMINGGNNELHLTYEREDMEDMGGEKNEKAGVTFTHENEDGSKVGIGVEHRSDENDRIKATYSKGGFKAEAAADEDGNWATRIMHTISF
ncbi:hypothetical protein BX659_1092 [Orenia metallireducens]|uniref:Uncharacterized protein n=1 Tax=Orenia metallireducens TaxID=1413210 RepID=A0A285H1K8_9FIRM|nr:hypothetical protein [Orenia metallireducens]PRX29418.1 hypothetical protein BX659_1092 [Orenia metallireducens]SNY29699.1 hypothetical protein SAMN06265827_1132 [Orenia metallireducens]